MANQRDKILGLFDRTVRRQCRCIGRQVERLDRVTRVTGPSPSPYDNLILWSDLNASNVDQELDKHLAYFDKREHDFGWFVYEHDQPSDLAARLQSRGLKLESQATVVIANPSDLGEFYSSPGIKVRQLKDPADVSDSLAVSNAVWGMQHHEFVRRWLTDLIRDHPNESTVLVAYHDELPIGTSWSTHWKGDPFASFFGGTVLPNWRGKGVYRAMVTERAKIAATENIDWCVVDAGSESFPILQRIGFKPLTQRYSLHWHRKPNPSDGII